MASDLGVGWVIDKGRFNFDFAYANLMFYGSEMLL